MMGLILSLGLALVAAGGWAAWCLLLAATTIADLHGEHTDES